jgi:hypothetical protein
LHVLGGLMLRERNNFAHQNELQVASRWCFVTEKYGIKSHDACLDLCAAIRWAANPRVLVSVMPVCEFDARGRTRCRPRIAVLVLGVVIGLEGCGDAQRSIEYRHQCGPLLRYSTDREPGPCYSTLAETISCILRND